jgi:hypothetical protein
LSFFSYMDHSGRERRCRIAPLAASPTRSWLVLLLTLALAAPSCFTATTASSARPLRPASSGALGPAPACPNVLMLTCRAGGATGSWAVPTCHRAAFADAGCASAIWGRASSPGNQP